jgi:hypothetical protein
MCGATCLPAGRWKATTVAVKIIEHAEGAHLDAAASTSTHWHALLQLGFTDKALHSRERSFILPRMPNGAGSYGLGNECYSTASIAWLPSTRYVRACH